MHVAIVAGEASGDQLGSELIRALRKINPTIRFDGVGGEKMIEMGFKSIVPQDELAVMGISEVLVSLPKLLKLRKQLFEIYQSGMPDVFIGIDSPDFNLGLERKLREVGVTTVHYVSPSVWAWREDRVHGIKKSVDLMLTLFDFEKKFYDRHGVPAVYCGHPLVDMPSIKVSAANKRQSIEILNINNKYLEANTCKVVGIFPGSREGEVKKMMPVFSKVVAQIMLKAEEQASCLGDIEWIVSATSPNIALIIQKEVEKYPKLGMTVSLVDAKVIMQASDAVMLASGTITLEAMLMRRPMLVSYKVSGLTAFIARILIKRHLFSLPNIIADHPIVPEYIQGNIDINEMADDFISILSDKSRYDKMQNDLERFSGKIKSGGAKTAAKAVYELINRPDFG